MAGAHVPVMPLVDVFGKVGTPSPEQIVKAVPKLKVGVMTGFTVTVKVTDGAQGSEELVNVYEPLAVLLTIAGLHVPVIPLVDVVGKTGTVPPAQIVRVGPKLKRGVMIGCTVSVYVTGTAH